MRLPRVDRAHRGTGGAHFLPFELLVVHEHQRVDADVQRASDRGDRPALWLPMHLRVEEVVGEAEGLEPCEGILTVVLARDGLEDPPGIELLDHGHDAVAQADALASVLDERAVPQRVVEIPHHALTRGCRRRGRLSLRLGWRLRLRTRGGAFLDEVDQAEIERQPLGVVRHQLDFEGAARRDEALDFRQRDLLARETWWKRDEVLEAPDRSLAPLPDGQGHRDLAVVRVEHLTHAGTGAPPPADRLARPDLPGQAAHELAPLDDDVRPRRT